MGNSSQKEVKDKPVVLVVGAGYAGNLIAKNLDKNAKFNVVLIDRKNHHVHNMAACRWVVGGCGFVVCLFVAACI